MQQCFFRTSGLKVFRFLVVLLFLNSPCIAIASGHMGHQSASDSWGIPGDLLIFPDVSVISRFDQEPTRKLAYTEIIPELNLFYATNYKNFRFLGEFLLSTKSHNVERLQFGLNLGESSLWLGRFHSPIGYWNMQYHHAAILQTSISRPSIMTFETFDGVIPNHLTGLLFEGIHEFDGAGLYYTLGAGAGPDITDRLSPFNIFEPAGSHRPGVAFRLGYQPISYGADEIGISGAYTELPGNRINVSKIKQVVGTVYGSWQFNDFHFLSEIVYVNNWLDFYGGDSASNDFVNAYSQLAWDVNPDWTVYGRIEGTLGSHNDPYLALFPKYVEDRFLGGIRYNLNHNMALKLEASKDHVRDDHFGQVMFQWSAVFP